MTSRQHSQAFDLFRAIAVSSVVFGHFFQSQTRIPLWVKYISQIPIQYGVPIFFLISGFLLAESFQSLRTTLPDLKQNYVAFMRRRIYRIYPAYLTALVFLFFFNHSQFLDVIVHAGNVHTFWKDYNRSMNGVFWSLGVEFQWYVLAPFMISALLGANKNICVAAIGVLLLCSVFTRNYYTFRFIRQDIDFSELIRLGSDQTVIHLYAFAFGIFLYRIRESAMGIPKKMIRVFWIYLILAGMVSYHLFLQINARSANLFVLANLCYVSQIVLAAMIFHYRAFVFGSRIPYAVVSFVSLVSYGLYIWHLPVLHFVLSFRVSVLVQLILYTVFSLTVATVSYFLVERYFLRKKRHAEPPVEKLDRRNGKQLFGDETEWTNPEKS